ncbi:hypothetical protein H4696_009790 [Amycolatopsis lexingtonensis]|uniref:Uncharacterized protein n=1 Tax=Amycolatopsis lexingtonensis TaxID=218822 RepID=A0ABR9IHP4_9PSEU|nr:hypothetical protein [Amycolatopsis lexingtonensis]MBE1502690.1 hypothetical protein [Amycolatopsis lexingtonensis]
MTAAHSVAAQPTVAVLAEVSAERTRQDELWGEQNHPDGTGSRTVAGRLRHAARVWWERRRLCRADNADRMTWRHVLREEVAEALAEHDPALLRAELVQVAATAVCWIEAIDRRTHFDGAPEAPATQEVC